MPMKTERITILATPDFKLFLGSEAKKQKVRYAMGWKLLVRYCRN
jgi:hypothetical protein